MCVLLRHNKSSNIHCTIQGRPRQCLEVPLSSLSARRRKFPRMILTEIRPHHTGLVENSLVQVPYFLMLVFAGLPVFFLEIFLGQYSGVGPVKTFGRLLPILRGLGYVSLM